MRDNKSSTVFKCRFIVDEDKKECSSTFTLQKIIHLDFEKGAIKAFKIRFPGVKIVWSLGCHFNFSSAIHKKVFEIGLGNLYSGRDEVWEEMNVQE